MDFDFYSPSSLFFMINFQRSSPSKVRMKKKYNTYFKNFISGLWIVDCYFFFKSDPDLVRDFLNQNPEHRKDEKSSIKEFGTCRTWDI